MKALTSAERLVVAADFDPRNCSTRKQTLELALELKDTGVMIKMNSGLRKAGYELIDQLHELDLLVFADLKLNDIPETLERDGVELLEYKPELLTVMCGAKPTGIARLKAVLGDTTELLGVTLTTDQDGSDAHSLYGCDSVGQVVERLALRGRFGKVDGFVCSGHEIERLSVYEGESLTFNIPAIRPAWSIVEADDQKRVVTPGDAIRMGATRIIVGRPILQAKDRREAVLRTIEEIESASAA